MLVPGVRGGRHDTVAALQAGSKPKNAAFAEFAVGSDFSLHQSRKFAGNGQSNAGAPIFAGDRGISLLESIEQTRHVLGCNANTGVLNFKAHLQIVCGLLQQQGAQRNGAVFCELDRIACKIEQRLAQPRGVPAQPDGHAIGVYLHAQPLGLGLLVD